MFWLLSFLGAFIWINIWVIYMLITVTGRIKCLETELKSLAEKVEKVIDAERSVDEVFPPDEELLDMDNKMQADIKRRLLKQWVKAKVGEVLYEHLLKEDKT